VPGAVAAPVGGVVAVDPRPYHHVELLGQEALDHGRRAGGVVGGIAVHQHVDVRLHVGEHPPHHVAFALMALVAHLGPGGGRDGGRVVAGIVVVDVDRRV